MANFHDPICDATHLVEPSRANSGFRIYNSQGFQEFVGITRAHYSERLKTNRL